MASPKPRGHYSSIPANAQINHLFSKDLSYSDIAVALNLLKAGTTEFIDDLSSDVKSKINGNGHKIQLRTANHSGLVLLKSSREGGIRLSRSGWKDFVDRERFTANEHIHCWAVAEADEMKGLSLIIERKDPAASTPAAATPAGSTSTPADSASSAATAPADSASSAAAASSAATATAASSSAASASIAAGQVQEN